jgi:hypothetical protein
MTLDGIVPIIPTPFDTEEEIDWQSLRRLLDSACSIDVSAICLSAYASEFYKLAKDERRKLIALPAEYVLAGRQCSLRRTPCPRCKRPIWRTSLRTRARRQSPLLMRDLRMDLAAHDAEHIDFLNANILALL